MKSKQYQYRKLYPCSFGNVRLRLSCTVRLFGPLLVNIPQPPFFTSFSLLPAAMLAVMERGRKVILSIVKVDVGVFKTCG